ncbi:MAG: undecaprenyl-diphosphate phosphatase [Acidimicrobiia bacterium]
MPIAVARLGSARVTRRLAAAPLVVAAVLVFGASPAFAVPLLAAALVSLGVGHAIVLGLVEGITEYLPISSTGHLLLTSRILGLPTGSGKAGDALKSYEIAIQAGAIVAVLGLYRHRFVTMIEGITKRSVAGRRLLFALAVAFVPAAVVGVIGEKVIKKHLFGVGPVIGAWAIGGLLILVLVARGLITRRDGRAIETITTRDALIIGIAQVAALWPGTSRSLVTIVAALFLGLSMSAAIEFSFLLGVLTLGAATAYSVVKDGSLMVDSFGLLTPLIGLVFAFLAAVVSVRWMVTYLQRHTLAVFGWYRIGIAAVALVLVLTKAI